MIQVEPKRVIPGTTAEIIEREKFSSVLLVGYKLESVGVLLPAGEESWPENKANRKKNIYGNERFMTSWKHLMHLSAVHGLLNYKSL